MGIKKFLKLTPEQIVRLDKFRKRWKERTKPLKEAISRSQTITSKDLAVTINARAEDVPLRKKFKKLPKKKR